ncbi:MFS transporter [Pseudonocardia lacus]|uniref:MFS transporter n=1 Tax=Pseudonocardia lacus TaxID=2835865 RepID=UPI001BDC43F6|nr:MFS transporter [Pseudonocardia lacus]
MSPHPHPSPHPSPPPQPPALEDPTPPRSAWFAVASLGLGIFTLVASEFLPASLLPLLAADLGVTEGTAGQLVTATSLAGIVGGPLVVSLLPRADRRLVMVGLTAAAAISDVAVAVAPHFAVMLVSRLLLGLALSGFWALTLAVTASLVPADRLGRAMTVVNTGVALATIAAVPAGAVLGELLGWRAAFLVAGAAGALVLVVQLAALPSVPPAGAPGVATLVATARRPVVALGVVAIVLIAGGHFMAFTFVRSAFAALDGLTPGLLALLLVVYGLASFAGNLVAGPLADRALTGLVIAAPVAVGIGTVLLALDGVQALIAGVAVAIWGLGFGAVPTMVQTWTARMAPDRLESASGLVVTAFQVAITAGAAIGGLLVDGVGVRGTLTGAAVAAVLGGLVLASAGRARTRVPEPAAR